MSDEKSPVAKSPVTSTLPRPQGKVVVDASIMRDLKKALEQEQKRADTQVQMKLSRETVKAASKGDTTYLTKILGYSDEQAEVLIAEFKDKMPVGTRNRY